MKIIAFVGMPASGKGEAANLVKEMGYQVVNMGDVIREEVLLLGLEPTDKNLGGTGTRLRLEEGLAAVAKRCIPKLASLDVDTAIVDGVRNIEEVELFKGEFGDDFLLINIEASDEDRLERIRKRGRADDKLMDGNALLVRDERELGWGMRESIKRADLTIENNGTVDEFREKVKKVLEKYR
jgi:dephospho-CoA kinase